MTLYLFINLYWFADTFNTSNYNNGIKIRERKRSRMQYSHLTIPLQDQFLLRQHARLLLVLELLVAHRVFLTQAHERWIHMNACLSSQPAFFDNTKHVILIHGMPTWKTFKKLNYPHYSHFYQFPNKTGNLRSQDPPKILNQIENIHSRNERKAGDQIWTCSWHWRFNLQFRETHT